MYNKEWYRQYYLKNKERIKERSHQDYLRYKWRWKTKHAKERAKEWRKRHRKEEADKARKWRKLNPEKRKANRFIHIHAKKYPLLPKCELCSRKKNLVHYHPDYEYKEIYVTVCASCHKWIHSEVKCFEK